MKIAVIGGGIAGLATAWLIQDAAEVVLYERADWLGGHARSVTVDDVHAETGFKYMFDATHPRVLALLRALGVGVRSVPMSTSVRLGDGGCVALPPRSLRQLGSLLGDPLALRGALALARIRIGAGQVARDGDWTPTLAAYLGRRFAPGTCSGFLLPFFAASWGLPIEVIAGFAAYDVVKVVGKAWGGFREVEGGVSRYVAALVAELDRVELRRATTVRAIRRDGAALMVEADDRRRFDHVVLAMPACCVPSVLAEEPSAEALRAVCARFRYVDTEIAIHRDAAWMPPRRDDWAIVNFVLDGSQAFVTEWCGYRERRDVFRTWLVPGRAPPRHVCHEQRFQHLVVTPDSASAQRQLSRLQGAWNLWAAGMYVTDVDVQESALRSALAIARRLAPASANLRRLAGALRRPQGGTAAASFEERNRPPAT
jgi:predicted NAD/FAD-binding protein